MQATITGYTSRPVTKPPNWHGLVTLDLLFNNLSTGLFLVAVMGELHRAGELRAAGARGLSDRPLSGSSPIWCAWCSTWGDPSRFPPHAQGVEAELYRCRSGRGV